MLSEEKAASLSHIHYDNNWVQDKYAEGKTERTLTKT